jgi:hypothetical protein
MECCDSGDQASEQDEQRANHEKFPPNSDRKLEQFDKLPRQHSMFFE